MATAVLLTIFRKEIAPVSRAAAGTAAGCGGVAEGTGLELSCPIPAGLRTPTSCGPGSQQGHLLRGASPGPSCWRCPPYCCLCLCPPQLLKWVVTNVNNLTDKSTIGSMSVEVGVYWGLGGRLVGIAVQRNSAPFCLTFQGAPWAPKLLTCRALLPGACSPEALRQHHAVQCTAPSRPAGASMTRCAALRHAASPCFPAVPGHVGGSAADRGLELF